MNWLALLLFLHLAGSAVWIGGAGAAVLVMRPWPGTSGTGDRPGPQMVMLGRLLGAIDIAMPTTLATGWAMATLAYGRPIFWPWALNAMQTVGIVMGGLFLLIRLGPFAMLREACAKGDRAEIAAQRERVNRLIAASLGLGGLSLVFAALLQA